VNKQHKILSLLEKTPIIGDKLTTYALYLKFKTEIDLLKNKSKTNSDKPSIIHFSTNKAATQHIKKVLRKIAVENQMSPVSFHDYAFYSKMPFLDHLTFDEMLEYKHIFKKKGYLYSVFGGMIENIDNINEYKIVLSMRDPRDVLVSSYFSKAFSHTEPLQISSKHDKFMKKRDWAKNIDINQYVLKEAETLHSILNKYMSDLCKNDNVGIIKYEDMILDYGKWLRNLVDIAGMKMSNSLEEELINENIKKRPNNENKFSQNRKGIAGDYKNKLDKATIEKLNTMFNPILSFFDYEIS